jgi:N-acetyl sugar amidotransferase
MDTSDPKIVFDHDGVCNHCHRAVEQLAKIPRSREDSDQALAQAATRIRTAAGASDYDSIIGLSGGVDSSYLACLAKRIGLNPLAVHFDNGWNTELAVENIQRVVEACSFDLHTYVIDWREFRDLQRAFLKASVLDTELPTDHAIFAALIQLAKQHKIKTVLSGWNVATEHGLPKSWAWNKQDWANIKAIHKAYGEVPLQTFPHISTFRWWVDQLITGGFEIVQLLNLMPYRRDDAARFLSDEIGWRDYGGKHHESLFTKFYQGSILPTKFGIDKRRAHLSDRVRNGELTREEALSVLANPVYTQDELRSDSEYVRKKLGFTEIEWTAILAAPPRRHSDFASDQWLYAPAVGTVRLVRRLRRSLKRRIVGRKSPPSWSTTRR